jgi:hypothetical protein
VVACGARAEKSFAKWAFPDCQEFNGVNLMTAKALGRARFALSKPALPSAPSKKSFSSVSSPIFAWRMTGRSDRGEAVDDDHFLASGRPGISVTW